jgi:hypothetical protein
MDKVIHTNPTKLANTLRNCRLNTNMEIIPVVMSRKGSPYTPNINTPVISATGIYH